MLNFFYNLLVITHFLGMAGLENPRSVMSDLF